MIRAGDIDLACRVEGPDDAPVVLLVHGVLTSHRIWDGVAARLAGAWRLVRYDLRGHGNSGATSSPYTMVQLALDALSVLDALGIGRAHVVGTSLGGMIGQVLGAAHGDRLVSLTLANTTVLQPAPKAWEERAAVAREKGVAALVDATLQRWFTPTCLREQPALIEAVRREALRTSVDGFVGCAAALRDLDHRSLLPRIRMPTLVLAGEHDTSTPPADARELERAIPDARIATLPASHQAAAEVPEAFAAAWTRFQRQHR
ncbi:MAG: alpha/beta fold hydrolase [Burkholderiales bacterium]|nr:alpha/beta fold hydrolase [Burkholderiales bacterium]